MNCLNCYQEIPDGTKFCPYCGAKQAESVAPESTENIRREMPPQPKTGVQPEAPVQPEVNMHTEMPAQPQANVQPEAPAQQPEAPVQPEVNNQAGGSADQPEGTLTQEGQSGPYSQSGQYGQNNTYGQNYTYSPNGQQGQGMSYSQAAQPGQSAQGWQPAGQEKTVNWVPYLILSIISTLCCCIPLGIVAIIYSAKTSSLLAGGRQDEARKAAKTAKIWIIIAFAAGILLDIIAFIFVFVMGAFDGYYGGIFDIIYSLRNMI